MAEGRVVGIDLGTTNSLVAYMENDTPVVIPGADGSNLVPSVVALDPIPAPIPAGGGRPTVTVGNSARKALIQTPERVIYSVKRLMGRGMEEVQEELKLFPFHLAKDMAGEVRYACLVAGGVGIAALYLLAKELIALGVTPVLFYGARTARELVLREYFERLGIQTCYATEDGSKGERGMVTAPLIRFLKKHKKQGVKLYACGPWAMMRAADKLARQYSVPCEVSLEARMGCSVGACMGCVVQTKGNGSPAHYIRVCMEGPVVNSRLIDWEHPPL